MSEAITINERRGWKRWQKRRCPIFEESDKAKCASDDPLVSMPREMFDTLTEEVERFCTLFICKAERVGAAKSLTESLRRLYDSMCYLLKRAKRHRSDSAPRVVTEPPRATKEWLESIDKKLKVYYFKENQCKSQQ